MATEKKSRQRAGSQAGTATQREVVNSYTLWLQRDNGEGYVVSRLEPRKKAVNTQRVLCPTKGQRKPNEKDNATL